jgi:membrane associated rhomboid family serine protease
MLLPHRIEAEQFHLPIGTFALIAAFLLIFAWMQVVPGGDVVLDLNGFVPEEAELATVPGSMLLHTSLFHLLVNIFFLWLFGSAVEGRGAVLLLLPVFLAGGCAGALAAGLAVSGFYADLPMTTSSAAISAVLGAAAVIFPAAHVRALLLRKVVAGPDLVSLPMALLLGAWFMLHLAYGALSEAVLADVGFWANVAGFAAGALFGVLVRVLHIVREKARKARLGAALDEAYEEVTRGEKPEIPPAALRDPSGAWVAALAGSHDPRELVVRMARRRLWAEVVSLYLAQRRGSKPSALVCAAALRALKRIRRPAPDIIVRAYLESPDDPTGEDELLYRGARQLVSKDKARAKALIQALHATYPDSAYRTKPV